MSLFVWCFFIKQISWTIKEFRKKKPKNKKQKKKKKKKKKHALFLTQYLSILTNLWDGLLYLKAKFVNDTIYLK